MNQELSKKIPEVLWTAIQMGFDDEVKSIRIDFKNENINLLEIQKKEDVKTPISQLLRDSPYQELIIKKHDDKVAHISRKIKLVLIDPSKGA